MTIKFEDWLTIWEYRLTPETISLLAGAACELKQPFKKIVSRFCDSFAPDPELEKAISLVEFKQLVGEKPFP